MGRYIELGALVAEIERRIKELQDLFKEDEKKLDSFQKIAIQLCIDECKVILSLLDTHEVKVDLDREIDDWYQNKASKEFENVLYEDIEKCAKHFFELGLKTSNPLTWEDIKTIDKLLNQCVDYSNPYQEVLKRFKTQKGE